MPIYEYQCNACGYRFEKLQKMSDDPIRDCPECSQADVKKLVSAAGFRLKGSGWYETDFKTGNKKNLADAPKEVKKSDKAGKKTSKESVK
ncbi:MAG: zinc ribbon domain-containing protein [Xanthomonadales bacterium]|nr:zinc ribbon domain-containing protein [Xanthomonadales bacterium]